MKDLLTNLDIDARFHDKFFRTLMEDANDDIFLLNMDGKIIYGNKQAEKLLGVSREEMKGRDYGDFVIAEDLKYADSKMRETKAGNSTHSEVRIRRSNGEEVFVHFSSVMIQVEDQKILMSIGQDITYRKNAEDALRKSDENFKIIIEKIPDGVLIVDMDTVLFVNHTLVHIFGFAFTGELLGRPVMDFIHPDFQPIMRKRIDNVFDRGGANPTAKIKYMGKGRKVVEVESTGISILFNRKPAVMIVVRDITLQNEIENKAMLNDKLATVGTLMAGVAHEVNNPLTYVLGNLAFLKEHFDELKLHLRQKGLPDALDLKFFKDILEELSESTKGSELIRDIVHGLKSFVRTDKGEVEEIDLNDAVRTAVKMVSHELRNRALLEENYAVDLPGLAANSSRLQQVFINLLMNASQSIEAGLPEDNKVTVRTGQKDGILFVEFSDTGKGIPKEVLPKIFDPFFTTKPVGIGTGLGLAVCKEILRQYQGTIEVQSKVNRGSTFTVRLPLMNGRKLATDPMKILAAV